VSILVVHDTPIKGGHHKSILDSVMKAFSQDYELESVVPHMPDKELAKIKPPQWLAETKRLNDRARKHDKILCLGRLASASIFEAQATIPITKIRGRGFYSPTGKFTVCSFSPSTCVKDGDYFRDLVFDIEKLVTHEAPIEQPELEIWVAENRRDVTRLLKDLHQASFLGVDTETTSLKPSAPSPLIPHVEPDILGIGFCALQSDDSGYVVVVPQEYIGSEVERFLKTYKGTFAFHNLKFDVQWIWKKFGRFEFHHVVDTMLMHWAMDERPFNRYRSHSLDLLQRLYFDAPPKSVVMKDWLEEYFRQDVGDRARKAWLISFCTEHPEMARTEWGKWHDRKYGIEPQWRGRKVGRDISVEEVTEALVQSRMPKELRPAPDKDRKRAMWDDMLKYMGEDCYSTARFYPLFKEAMNEESERLMVAHETYDIPASYTLANMELTGAPVNLPYLRKMKREIENQLVEEMRDIRAIVQEYTTHPKGEEFNPNSSLQVKEVLYDEEKGLGLSMPKGVGRYAYKRSEDEVTTNADTLKVLSRLVAKKRPGVANLIDSILRYRVKSKILGTYIDGILDRVDPDGRVRGEFNIHGTATARLSGSNPNLQNIPDASHVGFDIRRAYVPTKGWTILEADMSQLELRIAFLFSQDPLGIEAYKNGADIHQEVALMLWNKPKEEVTKYERYLAKCMNFGVIYGRGARSIATGPEMDNLVAMSGRSWGNSEIDAYFAKFKVGYKVLFDWMDIVKKDSMSKRYVEQPTGHRRRFDLILEKERGHIERQTVNTPIQGFAARVTVHALCEIDRRFDPEKQRLLFTVHDSLLAECRKEKKIIRETAGIILDVMENNLPEDAIMSMPALPHSPHQEGDTLVYNLPFVADVVTGPSWGDAHEKVEHLVVPVAHDDAETVLV